MKTKEFDNLKVGGFVYNKKSMCGQVSEINRTRKRISVIGLGNDIFWRYLHVKRPKNATSGCMCGICGNYEIVEKMV